MVRELPNHLIPLSTSFNVELLSAIAGKFGTPVFAYDAELLRAAWHELKAALPAECDLYYSVKANPSIAVLDEFRGLGAGFEVATHGELAAVRAVNADVDRVIMIGPGKRDEEIEEAISTGVELIVVESAREARRVDSLARRSRRLIDVALRINTGVPVGEGAGRAGLLTMGGRTQFGMPLEEASELIHSMPTGSRGAAIRGIHAYLGAAILDRRRILANTVSILEAAAALQREARSSFSFVGLGGGFGVPSYAGDAPLDLVHMCDDLRAPIRQYLDEYGDGVRLTFESGRFLTARAGVLVCRVIDVKQRGDTTFVVLDGGVGAVGGRDGYLGARAMPIAPLTASAPPAKTTICGPLCTPADRLAANVLMPTPEPGGLVAVYLAGAYGLTASAGLFLSHGWPAEVMVRGSEFALVRERTTPSQMLQGQHRWRSGE